MISHALESAQAKIEGFNFDMRHHLLEYDDVMNKHREIIYKKRREVLENSAPKIDFEKAGFKQEDFDKKKQELGEESFNNVVKFVSLKVLDTLWQEHLSNMEHMRDSVRLRAYGGKDPLIEYKNEGRKLFQQLLNEMDFEIADNILRAGISIQSTSKNPTPNIQSPTPNTQVGRNDPCHCGAKHPDGRPIKYKHCHGR